MAVCEIPSFVTCDRVCDREPRIHRNGERNKLKLSFVRTQLVTPETS